MSNDRQFRTVTGDFLDAIYVGMADSGTQKWHDLRSQGIGGSEIGTIMGLNPYESAFSLWAKRTGQIPDPPIDNWAVRFGKAFEEPILKIWAEANPKWDVLILGTYRHAKFDYMLANPDAIAVNRDTGEHVILEVKTARSYWDEVPPAYHAQVMHYMDVFNVQRSYIIGVAGWDWQEHEILRDDFEVEVQRNEARRFWDHLQAHVQPAWDGSKATYETVRQLYPNMEDTEVDLGILGSRLLVAQSDVDHATRELNTLKSQVLDRMGSAKYGVLDGKRIVSRQARGNGIPWLTIKKGK